MVDDRLVICVRIDGRDGCICVVLVQKRSEGGQLECNITLTSWLWMDLINIYTLALIIIFE